MKQIKLEITIEARHYDELTEEDRRLIDSACDATQRSYAPYSHFSVGAAALLENGIVRVWRFGLGALGAFAGLFEIGRASCRERV